MKTLLRNTPIQFLAKNQNDRKLAFSQRACLNKISLKTNKNYFKQIKLVEVFICI